MSASVVFLLTIGTAFLSGLVGPMIQKQFGLRFWICATVAVVFVGLAVIWQWVPAGALTESVTRIANDFRWWLLILVGLPWLSLMVSEVRRNNEVAVLSNDVQAIAGVLVRFVLPRSIDDARHRTILAFLKRFAPHEVDLVFQEGDNEATDFFHQIKLVLTQAGWTIRSIQASKTVQSGLSSRQHVTDATRAKPEDASNPNPQKLLTLAFASAGIPFNSIGGSSGGSIVADKLEVLIGRRLMDIGVMPGRPAF